MHRDKLLGWLQQPWTLLLGGVAAVVGVPGHIDDLQSWWAWSQISEIQTVVSHIAVLILGAHAAVVLANNRDPYRRFVRRIRHGVPVRYGVVSGDYDTKHVRVGHEARFRFTGEKARRFIELDADYRIEFTDLQIGFRWREIQEPKLARRR